MKNFSKKIEFHILQSFPVSCLNRDDVGSPKTAVIGGVTRARVSSQCWKRAVRLSLHELGVKLGLRTKKIEQELTTIFEDKHLSPDDAEKGSKIIASKITDDTLVFISENELYELANIYINLKDSLKEESKKDNDIPKNKKNKKDKKDLIDRAIKNIEKRPIDALDIVLFGRMIAKAPNMNVEAASMFSHAISTHKVSSEIDFFTAMDDLQDEQQDEQGSAHMGMSEYNSATYYRYVCLDIEQLKDSFGDDEEQIKTAVSSFIKALFIAVPSAKQNTMTAMCPWNYAKILVREGQPIQLSFEKPVVKDLNGGFLSDSIKTLNKSINQFENNFGSLYRKKAEITFSQENNDSIDNIIERVLDAL